jgi:hypothetical protein
MESEEKLIKNTDFLSGQILQRKISAGKISAMEKNAESV